MKKFLLILAVIAILLLAIAPLALAEEKTTTTATKTTTSETVREKFKTDLETLKTNRKSFVEAKKSEKAELFLTRSKTFSKQQLTIRDKVLTEQEKRLSAAACSGITSIDVKTPVQASVDAAQKTLATAATAIDSATTADQARTTMKTAVETTRVFAVLNPAISGLCISGRMLDKITAKYDPLVARVKKTGTDTTKLEGYLADAKTQINSAVVIYKAVLANTGATNAAEQLKTAKGYLEKARQALKAFSEELTTIKATLKTKEDSAKTTN